jgi:UDP-glucose:(heptosyl)LPS alpha-1,3-glucosyltransferase
MKKVAIFYKTFGEFVGGQEKVVYTFSHFLAERGYRVKVITAKVREKPLHPNIEIVKVTVPNLGKGLRYLSFAIISYQIGQQLKKEGYILFGFGKTFFQDIFRAGGGVYQSYVERARFKSESHLGRLLYYTKKKTSLSYSLTNLIEKLTFESKNLKYIIAPTLFVKEQITTHFNPKAEIKLIRNGVNLERFNLKKREENYDRFRKELNVNPDDFLLGYVSTNFSLKGFQYLLKALQSLKKRGYNFKLVAAGEKSRKWRKKIEKFGLKDKVLLLGKIRDVERVYFSCDLFVYPTLFDPSANVVLEAMASGTPVAASSYSGTGELIEEERLVIKKPEDPKEIERVLEFALSSGKELLTTWGIRNSQVVSQYPQEAIYEKYRKLVEEVS